MEGTCMVDRKMFALKRSVKKEEINTDIPGFIVK